jgi:hypothetical protein
MTTITTGTSGPQARKMILAGVAVGLAAIAIVNLPATTSDTTGQQATDASQAVSAESPQARSFFDENSATGRTPALPESVTGFEYEGESTVGQTVSPGVTTQYLGNSGELFSYENGPAPQAAPQGFLDGPSSGTQGASRVDPRAAVAAGLNPGAIDAIVGGTTRVAPLPDNLADAQDRASAGTQAQALATSDEALVNPVPEVDAAQLIAEIIASERSAPAFALAASDEALVRGTSQEPVGVPDTATNARWEALDEAYRNSTTGSYYTGDPDPVAGIPANVDTEAAPQAEPHVAMANNQIR